jgi:hypothetical protein
MLAKDKYFNVRLKILNIKLFYKSYTLLNITRAQKSMSMKCAKHGR